MKRILALILALALCISLFTFGANAALAPALIGDMNYDHTVNILDATLIQRALAGISQISDYYWAVADFDRDGEATSIDVTWIQRQEAMMDVSEGYGGEADPNITVHTFYADYDSGKAAVGVPVTFTADATLYDDHTYSYEFFVDGVMVQSRSEKNSFTHTFTESGYHKVNVAAYNPDGFCDRASYSDYYFENDERGFNVVDSYSYDQLELISVGLINYMFGDPSVKVRASGGTAPYTYSYRIPDMSDGYDYWGSDVEHYNSFVERYGEDYGWKLLHDDENGYYLYQDFSSNDTVYIPLGMFSPRSGHDVYIQAKDAEGNLTDERSVYFDDEILIG